MVPLFETYYSPRRFFYIPYAVSYCELEELLGEIILRIKRIAIEMGSKQFT
jgi:hypothetical protein